MKSAPTRWYAHGDQHEDATDRWYCSICDLFLPVTHFDARANARCRSPQWDEVVKRRIGIVAAQPHLYRPVLAANRFGYGR